MLTLLTLLTLRALQRTKNDVTMGQKVTRGDVGHTTNRNLTCGDDGAPRVLCETAQVNREPVCIPLCQLCHIVDELRRHPHPLAPSCGPVVPATGDGEGQGEQPELELLQRLPTPQAVSAGEGAGAGNLSRPRSEPPRSEPQRAPLPAPLLSTRYMMAPP
jgi:hypothetical protein